MQRINNSSAVDIGGGDLGFTAGDPGTGQPATTVDAEWLNSIQEELATVIESESIALDGSKTDQLLQAITQIAQAFSGGASTGDYEHTLRSTPKAGYIFMLGQTLGDDASGADLEGSDYQNLYTFYWDNLVDTDAPVSGGRGVSASADWAAGKTIQIIDGSRLVQIGKGPSDRIGQIIGSNSLTLEKTNLPNETLSYSGTTTTDGNHDHDLRQNGASGADANGLYSSFTGTLPSFTNTATAAVANGGSHNHDYSGETEAMGDGTAIDTTPEGFVGNFMQKL